MPRARIAAARIIAPCLSRLANVQEDRRARRVLELGAGTGLCSLAAAAAGHKALATDYRAEPLELLQQVGVPFFQWSVIMNLW